MKLRKAFFLVGAVVLAPMAILILASCSSDDPPAANLGSSSFDGSITGDGSNVKDGTGPTTDGGTADGQSLDGETKADVITPPKTCLDQLDASTTATCPANGCTGACNDILASYKPGIAQFAVECIAKLPECTIPANVRTCVDQAVTQVCSDSTANTFCTPLVTQCDPPADSGMISENACVAVASSLTSAGRQVFSTCIQNLITEGDCSAKVAQCFNAIRQ